MRGDEAGGYSSWLKAAVRDLQRHRGSSAIIPGCFASPAVHALSHAMNAALGNIGSTVVYTDPIEAGPLKHIKSLLELVDDMRRGVVDLLIIIDSNPVYDAPADIGFAKEIKKAAYSVYMGMHGNETAALCRWLVPATHYLESWGDVRAFDGTASIIQPLIAPVYGGISPHSLIAILQGAGNAPAMEIVKSYWRKQINSPDFEKFWEEALKSGILPNTQAPGRSPALKSNWAADWKPVRKGEGVEIVFRPDPAIYDGRFSNNGYLQDLPKPISKLTWDNAAFVSPRTARHLGYNPEELTKTHSLGFESPIVRLKLHGRKVEAPLSILPGHPDATVSVSLGYGRSRAGNIGTGHGFDAYKLRASTALWQDDGLEIEKTEQKMMLAVNQHTWLMHERQADIYRLASWETIQKDPENIKRAGPRAPHKNETLYRTEFNYRNGYQWGLTVDLSKCTGCHACVSACDIENNVPFLNKVETSKGRWMHWLRIDRYYSGEGNNAKILFQPMLCMQCELAPCEYVCPVQATNHSAEGINQMVYNRCVGTKFCSNNCPWKVRRFNFYQYSNYESPSFAPLYNPDVTVRGRGVMEKCNYCIQRIQQIRIVAEMQQRKIEDGEIVMACQAACPTQVFVFGDLNDPDSALSRSAASPVNYATLAELNTRPRTTYLAKIFNPNPEIKG
jgi:molybdopterin-containing oxidoreductase family iron-sulfur binding subunit